jgi:hypothetical protein
MGPLYRRIQPVLNPIRRASKEPAWQFRGLRDDTGVPNALDFLVLLDSYTRESSLGYVSAAHELQMLAQQAELVPQQDNYSVVRWTGELVHHGYVDHGPQHLGDPRPMPPGTAWTENDVQRVRDFRVTPLGREEADRMRRLAREATTDVVLGAAFPHLLQPWMDETQRRAITTPLVGLRSALDSEQHSGVLGAAKDLVEAACQIALARSGRAPREQRPSLPALFKEAHRATASEEDIDVGTALGPSLAATVDRLAQLRNSAGTGHGRAAAPTLTGRQAQLAASAAIGVAGSSSVSTPRPQHPEPGHTYTGSRGIRRRATQVPRASKSLIAEAKSLPATASARPMTSSQVSSKARSAFPAVPN